MEYTIYYGIAITAITVIAAIVMERIARGVQKRQLRRWREALKTHMLVQCLIHEKPKIVRIMGLYDGTALVKTKSKNLITINIQEIYPVAKLNETPEKKEKRLKVR